MKNAGPKPEADLPSKPTTNTKHVQKAARAAKLAKALKANIKRRKGAASDLAKS